MKRQLLRGIICISATIALSGCSSKADVKEVDNRFNDATIESIARESDVQEMITVPDVTGIPYTSAESTLNQQGLNVAKEEKYSDYVAEGIVISQSLEAGSTVTKDSTITLVVSKGVEVVEVPDVPNMDESSAVNVLKNCPFVISVTYEYSESVAEGYVISQSESAGSKLAKGSEIAIIISLGVNK